MSIRSKLSSLREYLTPINNESNFRKTGEITPEEFVKAGDYLVYKFPTWKWGTCPPNLQKKFLPADKQFLITKHVPLYQRVASYLPESQDATEDDQDPDSDSEWVPRINTTSINAMKQQQQQQDLDDLMDDNVEDAVAEDDLDEFTHIESNELNLRKYDLYISYSTSYRVPKMYLVGFSANGIPLLPHQMYEDISGDYKDKTATIENLPMSYNTTSVSIHPCKHLSVMKVFMKHAKAKATTDTDLAADLDKLDLESEDDGIRVDQYLVIFLKFIASVTPGIEYDFTMDAL
ncbi:CIC11C00000004680 [Sungouiella intermedia]|uniref:Autophagy-related protein 3 n=1 Tax=Sungouiella intermedia TaxID=45354 RepID=A0A1L0DAG7_9ASCO|nr:CIC11C00000004680 [[Candida] intermedia]SGZ49398.1 CIC11C00000003377 [[Candida] intermedia]